MIMKCHYEVLEIPRDATINEIKSAYRKLALKWHPDKNLDNVELAKEQFQLVQQAYEILSDPQERSWYDRHREQILRGPSSEFKQNSLDLFQYFTTTCFKGYGDDENGFYTVYNNVFKRIVEEDMEFIDDKQEFLDIPQFGNSSSDYETVVSPFYAYWSNYQTKKSFVWLDTYDITETKDRRVVKLMEKENKKIRQKAKKEYNEEVRNLVAFVKKRDKRVQEYTKLMEEKTLKNRQKLEEYRKQKKMERLKELEENSFESDWMKFDNVKSELEDIEKHLNEQFGCDNDTESDNDDYDDNLYCVACNKIFKTTKSFQNHESSKKHREAVELIKDLMNNEDEDTINNDINEDENTTNNEINEDEDSINNEISENDDSSNKEDIVKEKKKSKKQKRSKKILQIDNDDLDKNNFNFNANDKEIDSNIATTNSVEENNVNKSSSIADGKIKNKKPKKQQKNEINQPPENSTTCLTCNSSFPSKNKLFNHLKSTGHGVPLPTKKRQKK